MGVIIRNGIEYSGAGGIGGGGCDCDIVYLTQEAYDALPESKLTNGVEYRITDANTDNTKARNIAYDNSASGLEATSVQDAIDVMNESLEKQNPFNFIKKDVNLVVNSPNVNAVVEGTFPELIGAKMVVCKSVYLGSVTIYNVGNNDTERAILSYPTPVSEHGYEACCFISVNFGTGHVTVNQSYIGSTSYNEGARMGITTIYYIK